MAQNFAVANEWPNTTKQYDILSSGFPPKILYTFPIPILSLWPSLDVQLGETDHKWHISRCKVSQFLSCRETLYEIRRNESVMKLKVLNIMSVCLCSCLNYLACKQQLFCAALYRVFQKDLKDLNLVYFTY
jgi:hypothetical protein